VWVKICGIRDVETALVASAAGADALGLNFYRPSPRSTTADVAAEIVRSLPGTVEPVGLFVNSPVDEIRSIAATCGLRTLQLHGDEPAELLAALGEFRLIRVFRVGPEGLAAVDAELARLESLGVRLFACLVDARVEGAYGGTGRTAPWELLAREWPRRERPRLILAGGLTPGNVAEAIRRCTPWGVDVAGGVEFVPGVKDPGQIREFVKNARTVS
jgi:phosphoribosylanthranilate isomerase